MVRTLHNCICQCVCCQSQGAKQVFKLAEPNWRSSSPFRHVCLLAGERVADMVWVLIGPCIFIWTAIMDTFRKISCHKHYHLNQQFSCTIVSVSIADASWRTGSSEVISSKVYLREELYISFSLTLIMWHKILDIKQMGSFILDHTFLLA